MLINHLMLKRTDGSELRENGVQASGEVRDGATIELSLRSSEVIRATVTHVDDRTTVSQIGEPYATGQLTVIAVELPQGGLEMR